MARLLTTAQVAELLQVHPKHVYRLLKRGLPGRRVGGEWRFDEEEVLAWTRGDLPGAQAPAAPPPAAGAPSAQPDRSPHDAPPAPTPDRRPPILAANGDLAVEALLALVSVSGPPFVGLLAADGGAGMELLARGEVLAAGYHGPDPVPPIRGERTVETHLVRREVGFAARSPDRLPTLADLPDVRLASRPVSAGVRRHLDRALQAAGIDPVFTHSRARLLPSHRDVVLAVARGEADVGLATRAWARRLGLAFAPMVEEDYGIIAYERSLNDPALAKLLEVSASRRFRKAVSWLGGYDASRAGELRMVEEAPD